jgi:DHA2 family methylenomycin A resistance protein-like MFS transporter
VLAVMCAGMFLVLLDVTIVNVALPSIGHDLRADVAVLQWVVDGYAVTIAGLLLAAGVLGDRFGHRRMLLTGFTLFGLASLLCAPAPSAGVLVAGRVVQGVGGALLLPSTMAVIVEAYPDRGAQARALGMWAAISSLALPAGPLLGGLLIGAVGWRMVFWINVPLVAAAVLGALLVVKARPGRTERRDTDSRRSLGPSWLCRPSAGNRHRPWRSRRGDITGVVCFVIGLSAVVFTVVSAGHRAGAPVLVISAAVALAALGGALRAELRSPNPVVPPQLLRRVEFAAPNGIALTMNAVFNGTLFVAMLYLQDVQHFSPLTAGLATLPITVPLVALAPVSGRLTARYGPRPAIGAGCAVAAAGSLLLLGVGHGIGWLLGAFATMGCGAGLITASVVAAVVRATPADRAGLATGVSNTARQVGTASGVAVFGAVAGAPATAAFVGHIHALGVAAAALWALAVAATFAWVER